MKCSVWLWLCVSTPGCLCAKVHLAEKRRRMEAADSEEITFVCWEKEASAHSLWLLLCIFMLISMYISMYIRQVCRLNERRRDNIDSVLALKQRSYWPVLRVGWIITTHRFLAALLLLTPPLQYSFVSFCVFCFFFNFLKWP